MSLSRADQIREAAAYKTSLKAIKPAGLTPPVTFTNATTKGPYKGHAMASPRADADAHMQHASRGLGVQIVRAV